MPIIIPDNKILNRGFFFLEDGNTERADECFEEVLNENFKCAEAYLGKLMIELKFKKLEEFESCTVDFTKSSNYDKIMQFGNDDLKSELTDYAKMIEVNADIPRKDAIIANLERIFKNSEQWDITDFDNALNLLETVKGYKNADQLIELYKSERDIYVENKRLEEEKRAEAQKLKRKKLKKNIFALSVLIVFFIALAFVFEKCVLTPMKYNNAVEFMESGNYPMAIAEFRALGDYKDSKDYLRKILIGYNKNKTISTGSWHTVGIKADGTVVAVGDNDYGQCNVSGWKDIVEVSAGNYHTVGLKADGTVVAVGDNDDGQCNVLEWMDIVAVSARNYHTVGLKADGTVVAVGDNDDGQCNVSEWMDIVAVSAGWDHTVGLKADGTVVAVGNNDDGQCNVSEWTDIVAVSAGRDYTVGLKADGTVVAFGSNASGRCEVLEWEDVIAISAGSGHTVCIKADGTTEYIGEKYGDSLVNRYGVSDWKGIVAISAGEGYTVGLKADGTVVDDNPLFLQACYDTYSWENIKMPSIK